MPWWRISQLYQHEDKDFIVEDEESELRDEEYNGVSIARVSFIHPIERTHKHIYDINFWIDFVL